MKTLKGLPEFERGKTPGGEDYPNSEFYNLVERISSYRSWTINAGRSMQDHHGIIAIHEDPLYIELGYGKSIDGALPRLDPQRIDVGLFRLNLKQLFQKDFIRHENDGNYRLRFVVIEGDVYIQINGDSEKLWIARIEEQSSLLAD